jgi:hypothetical protein
VQLNEIQGKEMNMPAASARETQNRLPSKRKHNRSRLAHASNFSFARETLPKEHLSVTRNERQILSLALLSGSASPNIRGSAIGKYGRRRGEYPRPSPTRETGCSVHPCRVSVHNIGQGRGQEDANARDRDQGMRATLVCWQKSFSAVDISAAVPLDLHAQRER